MTPSDEELYGKHAPELVRFAATLVGPALGEDLTAQAFVRCLQSPGWAQVSNRRAYLYRAVVNEAHSLRRSQRSRVAREELTAHRELVDAGEARVDVLDAIRRLSVRQRAVVFLSYWGDCTTTEISETLGCSSSTVERELRSARRHLKGMLS